MNSVYLTYKKALISLLISSVSVTLVSLVMTFIANIALFHGIDYVLGCLIVLGIIVDVGLIGFILFTCSSKRIISQFFRLTYKLFSLSYTISIINMIMTILVDRFLMPSFESLTVYYLPAVLNLAHLLNCTIVLILFTKLDSEYLKECKKSLVSISAISLMLVLFFVFLRIENTMNLLLGVFDQSGILIYLSLSIHLFLSIKCLRTISQIRHTKASSAISLALFIVGNLCLLTHFSFVNETIYKYYNGNNHVYEFYPTLILIGIGILLIYLSNIFETSENIKKFYKFSTLVLLVINSLLTSLYFIVFVIDINYLGLIVFPFINSIIFVQYTIFKDNRHRIMDTIFLAITAFINLAFEIVFLSLMFIDVLHYFETTNYLIGNAIFIGVLIYSNNSEQKTKKINIQIDATNANMVDKHL